MAGQKNETTKLALKLAGIYILVQAIFYIPTVVSGILMLGQNGGVEMNFVVGFATLTATFLLLVFLGIRLVYKNKPEFDNEDQTNADLAPLAIAIGGIIIFAIAISDLPYLISMLGYDSILGIRDNVETNGIMRNAFPQLLGNLFQLALGLALFFKAKYFAKLIK